jgi:hypothetical protein
MQRQGFRGSACSVFDSELSEDVFHMFLHGKATDRTSNQKGVPSSTCYRRRKDRRRTGNNTCDGSRGLLSRCDLVRAVSVSGQLV